jgi:uncharacterized protein YfiM (DUF2279 family)
MRLTALPALLCVLTASSWAGAQVADPVVAEALFRDGRALFEAGRISEACRKFAESQRIDPKLGTLLNLARCHKDEAKFASAWEEYSEAVRVAKRTSQKDREELAQAEITQLETVLTRVVINMPAPVTGQEVTLDGLSVRAETFGTPLPINPGEHKVEVKAPGHEPLTLPLVAEKTRANLTLEIPALKQTPKDKPAGGPSEGKPATPPGEVSTSFLTKRTGAYIALGVGVVGVGAGVVFGLRTLSKRDEAAGRCPNNLCDPTGKELGDQAKSSATLSTVGVAVGVAGLATGITLFVLSRPSAGAVAVMPMVTPQSASLSTQVRF